MTIDVSAADDHGPFKVGGPGASAGAGKDELQGGRSRAKRRCVPSRLDCVGRRPQVLCCLSHGEALDLLVCHQRHQCRGEWT